MKVHNDLLLAADNGDVSVLCLLDLTAAFDTVDHDLMMWAVVTVKVVRGVRLHRPTVKLHMTANNETNAALW